MSFTCHLDLSSAAVASAFAAHAGPDPWEGGVLTPNGFVPVMVRNGAGAKLLRPMHWGYPAPGQSTELVPAGQLRWVHHVRNLESPYWIGNLRHSGMRCLFLMTHIEMPISAGPARRMKCSMRGRLVFAVAGIWRDLTDMPVCAMLVTEASGALRPVEGGKAPISMPAILSPDEGEEWLRADWQDARKLIRPYSGRDLEVEEL